MTYNTRNPLGSNDPRDLFDNAQNFDKALNELVMYWIDRLGVQRLTEYGRNQLFNQLMAYFKEKGEEAITAVGWQEVGDWSIGLQITNRNQILSYDGSWYKFLGELPHTIAGDSPENDGGIWSSSNTAGVWANIGDAVLRSNLGSRDGLKWIGRCSNLAALRSIEPSYSGQVIDVVSAVDGWAATSAGLPLGGGRFVYMDKLASSSYADDGGTIIVTAGGSCWVREILLTDGSAKIHATWFGAPNDFETDASDIIQKACDAALFWTTNTYDTSASRGQLGMRGRVILPKKWAVSKSISYNSAYVELDGDDGVGLALNTGTYTNYAALSGYKYVVGIMPKKVDNAWNQVCYAAKTYAKNITLVYGSTDSVGLPTYVHPTDTKIIALAHNGLTSTIYSAQGEMQSVSVIGFGVGYMNGNYAWGLNWYGAKFVSCYDSVYLISGSDNGERMNFFSPVFQNGYHSINVQNWAGDGRVFGGSSVWMYGTHFNFVGVPTWDIQLSRLEYITQPASETDGCSIIKVVAGSGSGVSQKYPMINFSAALCLLSISTQIDFTQDIYLFDAGTYCTINIRDSSWQHNSFTYTKKMKLVNDASGGTYKFSNNAPMRIGSFALIGRQAGASMSMANISRLSGNIVTDGVASNFTSTFASNAWTLECATTHTDGYATFTITAPLDNWRDVNVIYPYLLATNVALTQDGHWFGTLYYSNSKLGASNDISFGDFALYAFNGTETIISPAYASDYSNPTWKNRRDLSFIPDQIKLKIAVYNGAVAGDKIVIKKICLGGV